MTGSDRSGSVAGVGDCHAQLCSFLLSAGTFL
uniref:Uncharacterized protein n=1 Tax=Setaria italica TaxID=4555 RepID=K3XTQ2_SETIT